METRGRRCCRGTAGENVSGAVQVLNLFAYTGGATLAAGSAGASVTHVDSVKPVVSWARENMEASGLDGVRWIVDDALKFARREVKRGRKYSGIILDPPAYGRGPDGEKWILEENLNELLRLCGELLDPEHGFLVLNLYSMGLSALLARTAVRQLVGDFTGEQFGELYFNDSFGKALPLGGLLPLLEGVSIKIKKNIVFIFDLLIIIVNIIKKYIISIIFITNLIV